MLSVVLMAATGASCLLERCIDREADLTPARSGG
jgi:hypothetical protein